MAAEAQDAAASPLPALPQIRRLRVCLLGGDTFQHGVGKADVAAALLRGLTADQPEASDTVFDLAFDYGVFERAWWELLREPPEGEINDESWGTGPLSAWDGEGRVRFDRRAHGQSTPPYDVEPDEDCASLCAGHAEKLNFGHKRSPGVLRAFRDALSAAGQDPDAFDAVHRELYTAAESSPRELVRRDRPCHGLLAAFARFSPEVGGLAGCGAAILSVFEPGAQPLGSSRNVAMLYAAAPNGRTHAGLSPGTFLCALRAAGSNIARTVREYNRLAGVQAAPGGWERAVWWKNDLRAQVEYYLSDRNLRADRLLREKLVAAEDGWLDMELVLSWERIAASEVTVQEELLDALSASRCVETKVADDGKAFVRRAGGRVLPKFEDGTARHLKRKWIGGESRNMEDKTCWDWVRKGTCPRGDKCRYEHTGPGAPAQPQPATENGEGGPPKDPAAAGTEAPTPGEVGSEELLQAEKLLQGEVPATLGDPETAAVPAATTSVAETVAEVVAPAPELQGSGKAEEPISS